MRIPTEDLNDWRCEECESSSKQNSPAYRPTEELPCLSKLTNSMEVRSSGELDSKKLRNGSWEKKVATGKTKYITANEAIKLFSGENKSLAPANVTQRSKSQRAEVGVKIFERTPIKPRNIPPGFPASGHSPQPKPQRLGNMEIQERARPKLKTLSEVHQSMSTPKPSQAPRKEHMQEEQPIGGTVRTTTELRASNAENVNNNLLADFDGSPCLPALDALWNGNFCIKDDHRPGELYHQIRAHPPSNVRRKIYEFSKKMPEVLDFQFVQLKDIWNNLFMEFSPDERDVGLYFFPSVRERSEGYISLLESISVKNLALRKQIADVELLIFTSELLPVNFQRLEGKSFLWGLFHHLKQHTNSRPSDQAEDRKETDMDIDMIGGIEVGIKDAQVKRAPLREKKVRFKEDCVTAAAAAAKFKMDTDHLVPPGFEDVHRLRQAQASSSLVKNADGARQGIRREADNRNGNRLGFPAKLRETIDE
ncbi:hypothetical protein CASFOL_018389 [Castilleja foliolosa]|uniref:AIPP2-like SPOC-like domain-containing protein n=1 Tax=Castilleja foliolosa TaxID=1961234 RepID=A0ABD3D6M2_9LAMI